MTELRKIYCNTLEELPNVQIIKTELIKHDRIRIDYSVNAKFKSSNKLAEYIQRVQQEFNVEIHKGEFKELEL